MNPLSDKCSATTLPEGYVLFKPVGYDVSPGALAQAMWANPRWPRQFVVISAAAVGLQWAVKGKVVTGNAEFVADKVVVIIRHVT